MRWLGRWVQVGCGVLVIALCCVVGGCGGSSHAGGAVIKVSPADGLYDQARTIVISRLKAGQMVTLTARSPRPDGVWAAAATFEANGAGVVDVARSAPLSGSYTGVSALGLLSSQHRVGSRSAPLNGVTVTTLTTTAGKRLLAITSAIPPVFEAYITLELPGTGDHDQGSWFEDPDRHDASVLWGAQQAHRGAALVAWLSRHRRSGRHLP